jgi:hypothetical protein
MQVKEDSDHAAHYLNKLQVITKSLMPVLGELCWIGIARRNYIVQKHWYFMDAPLAGWD